VQPIIQFSFANGSVINVTLRIYSPQLELGTFPTSPIITTGSAGTRPADVWAWTGAQFSSWYNQAGGLFVDTILNQSTGNVERYVTEDDGTKTQMDLGEALNGQRGLILERAYFPPGSAQSRIPELSTL
jgi:hypothetical protein